MIGKIPQYDRPNSELSPERNGNLNHSSRFSGSLEKQSMESCYRLFSSFNANEGWGIQNMEGVNHNGGWG